MNVLCKIGLILGVLVFLVLPVQTEAAVDVKKGTFYKKTSTGTQAVTGVGFTPKAIIFWATTQAVVGNANTNFTAYGFTAGSSSASVSVWSDAAGTSNTGRKNSVTNAIQLQVAGGTNAGEATLSSFDADGFTLNWSPADGNGYIIHYYAIGGSDIIAATTSSIFLDSTNAAPSVSNLGFQPDMLFFLNMGWVTATSTATTTGKLGIGFGDTTATQGGLGLLWEDNSNSSDTCSAQRVDQIEGLANRCNGLLFDSLGNINSFTANGFTLDISDLPDPMPSATFPVHFLALQGGSYKTGNFLKPTATGYATTTGLSFQPQGLMLLSRNQVAGNTVLAGGNLTLGAAASTTSAGTDQGVISINEPHNDQSPDPENRTSTTTIYTALKTTSNTLTGEADFTRFNSDGFTLNWTTADTTADEIIYWAIGNSYVTISGTCKQNDQSTNCTDTGAIKVAVNGVLQAETQATVAGTWSITGVAKPANGAIITVFIDGVASSEDRAVAVTKYDGTGDITSVELIEGRLSLGSVDNQTIANSDIATYDNSVAGDADIPIEVDAANDLVVDSNSSWTGEELYIGSGETYRPDSASSGNVATGNLENNGTITADGNTLTISGSWANSGTFTADTSRVTFNSATAETISGTLIGTSAFNKIEFNNSTGSWTVQNSASTTAANATDTFVIKNGTVTLGDGTTGIHVEVNGKVVIAGTAGETGTLQTAALTQGATTTVDINSNPTPATCANCTVQVGASSGAGQGNLKIRKNTVLRLNPRTTATASDTGIEVGSTGYLEIQGTQETTNTVFSRTQSTSNSVITVSGTPWSANQFNSMALRVSGPSNLAYGRIYDISATTNNTITINATTSPQDTNPSGTCSGNGLCTITPSITTMVTSSGADVGRYLYNVTKDKYYLIASTTNATDKIIIVNNLPDDFTTFVAGDDIEISDGIRANDTFEILDYAHVTAEGGVACTAAVNGSGEAYISATAGSESVIRYAHICNLGRGVSTVFGMSFDSVDGANANEGVTIEKSLLKKNYRNIYLTGASNNNGTKGVLENSIESTSNIAVLLDGAANANKLYGNRIFGGPNIGISLATSPKFNEISSNTISNFTLDGISLVDSNNNTISSNSVFRTGLNEANYGILISSSENNVLKANTVFSNQLWGIFLQSSANTTVASTTAFQNKRSNLVVVGSNDSTIFNTDAFASVETHSVTFGCSSDIARATLFGNSFHDNPSNGMVLESSAECQRVIGINESYGTLGANSEADLAYRLAGAPQIGPHRAYFYNTTFGSPTALMSEATMSGSFISRKHNGQTASTTIWANYVVQSDTPETPQNEAVDAFKYANNLWEKSATPHGYFGTGTEDSNLNYDLTTATLSGGPYHYRLVATSSAACTSALKFDVFRNTVAVGTASCGVEFTDSNGGVNTKFTIDGGTSTTYTAGDSYTFTVWDASNDTNTQKQIGLFTAVANQATSSISVPSGKTLELKGQSAGSNVTKVTRNEGSGGYKVEVAGTLDASNYSMEYLGNSIGQGLLLYNGATITSLNNGSFDNFAVNNGTGDSFIALNSDLVGAGQPSNVLDGLSFSNTNGNANCNVNATSTDATGFWEFTNYTGAFAGESTDCNDGAADPDPGQVKWTAVVNITVSGTIYSDEGQTPLNAAGKTIMLRVGTSTPGFFATTTVAGTGAWRIENLKSMSANATVRAWLDGDATFRAFSLTKASSTSNISNLDLYQNRLIIKREGTSAASTTITDLAAYDADDDADIQFSANGGALNVFKDQELHISAGNPFVPGGAVTLHGNASSTTDGSLHLDDNAAYSAGATTTLAGNWNADTGSLFISNGYDVVFNATTTGKTIAGTLTGANTFATTTFDGAGGGWTFSNNASTTGLTITVGSLTAPSGLLSIAGQYANNAGANGFTHNSGTVYFTGTSTVLSGTMTGNSAFNHVVFTGPVIADIPGSPASTASTTPTADCENVTGIGTQAWVTSTLTYCKASDNNMSQTTGGVFTTNYLKATNFGLSVPTDATIDGILVDVEKRSDADGNDTVSDAAARIVKGGTIGTTDKSKAGNWGTSNDYIVTYGSPIEKWGLTWTPSDINASNFGFAIAATVGTPGGAPDVDMIRVNVHYTTAGVSGSSGGAWSFGGNASTTNFTIANGTTTAPSGLLSISGNYTNNVGFTHNSGKVYLSGTTQQTVAGNLTSPSAFNNLDILNTSGTGDATQSVIFSNAVSASSTFTMLPSTSAQFLAGATSTFQNIDWNGIAAGTRVWLRSSTADSTWGLKVPGTRVASYVNARDSNACSNDADIEATESVNAGGNACWNFPIGVTGGGAVGGGSIESSGSAPPVGGGTPSGGEAPESPPSPPPPVEGGGGGGGGDVGYRGGTSNLAAVFSARSFERILHAIIKVIGSFPG